MGVSTFFQIRHHDFKAAQILLRTAGPHPETAHYHANMKAVKALKSWMINIEARSAALSGKGDRQHPAPSAFERRIYPLSEAHLEEEACSAMNN